jgi:hypothetical protein|uniref:Uncharacterized protein n=1 Tax=Populus trichocarpa TaxID=3694 RepID=A0A2K2BQQ8_POPTR
MYRCLPEACMVTETASHGGVLRGSPLHLLLVLTISPNMCHHACTSVHDILVRNNRLLCFSLIVFTYICLLCLLNIQVK